MTTDSDYARAVDLLVRDVVATVGEEHAAYVLARAAELREFDLDARTTANTRYGTGTAPGTATTWRSRSPDWATWRRRIIELARGWFAAA